MNRRLEEIQRLRLCVILEKTMKADKSPMLYTEYTQAGIGNNRVYGVLLCMKHLLKNDSHWNLFVDKIEMLFDKYQSVQIKTMGFPDNWKELLENK